MCGIIGVYLKTPSNEDFELIKRIFIETKIRGLHATGLSFIDSEGTLNTIKDSLPADKFVDRYLIKKESFVNVFGNICLIGHCRYSTSDLNFNQPLSDENYSIVHNGVISQEFPENWKSLYGYECKTRNDSELILHSAEPLVEFSHMSMGVCKLSKDNRLSFFRNGKRPVYLSKLKNGYVVTSTADIAARSGITNSSIIPMNYYFEINKNVEIEKRRVVNSDRDLQLVK